MLIGKHLLFIKMEFTPFKKMVFTLFNKIVNIDLGSKGEDCVLEMTAEGCSSEHGDNSPSIDQVINPPSQYIYI